ncbi:hypothetical protein Agub_g4941 [Astrephomene gubernaculifera]|uniref:Protein kinase domain-containing protein n=1 Tax=Astrephomene gubernaculifera TaxID=47775 RepID=A0AAD3DL12_9CHLO|nr:hypothetical protein Agub_g4941 [Astrephomene gubernaculifera]
MASLLHTARERRRDAPHAVARLIPKAVPAPTCAAPCTSFGTSPPEDVACSPADSFLASCASLGSSFSELSLGSSFDPPAHLPFLPRTTSLVRKPLPDEHASFLRKTLKKLRPGQQLPARKVRILGRGGVGEVTLLELNLPASTDANSDGNASKNCSKSGGGTLLLAHKAITCRRYDAARHARELAAMEAAAAGCPFILRVYGSSLPIGKPPYAIYTEYAPLGSLADLIESRRRHRGPRYRTAVATDPQQLSYFDEHEIRWLAARVLAALVHLHSLGLVHRDVSPHNIYRSASGHPLLADFDAVAAVDEDGYVYGTAGRLSCAAPEVRAAAYGGGPYNGARADMWGLGAVLLEMVSEQELCQGPTLEECSEALRDLILGGLLVPQARRLDAAAAQAHPFFEGVDWSRLEFEPAPLGLGPDGLLDE